MASLSADQGFHLLRDSKNFDFSIECNGIVVRAHADLLAVKTQYLAVCVQGQFKETEEGGLVVNDAEPYVVALAVLWLYTRACDTKQLNELWPEIEESPAFAKDPDLFEITSLVQLYVLADMWMMPDLGEYAANLILTWGLNGMSLLEAVRAGEPKVVTVSLKILSAVFNAVPAGASIRAQTVAAAFPLTDYTGLWHAAGSNAMQPIVWQGGARDWCRQIRKLLVEHEPIALQACELVAQQTTTATP